MISSSGYVEAAYLVFVLVLGWDAIAPRLRLRRAHRDILDRTRREAARKGNA